MCFWMLLQVLCNRAKAFYRLQSVVRNTHISVCARGQPIVTEKRFKIGNGWRNGTGWFGRGGGRHSTDRSGSDMVGKTGNETFKFWSGEFAVRCQRIAQFLVPLWGCGAVHRRRRLGMFISFNVFLFLSLLLLLLLLLLFCDTILQPLMCTKSDRVCDSCFECYFAVCLYGRRGGFLW